MERLQSTTPSLGFRVKRSTGHTHTHPPPTPTHTHDKNNTPNPQTNTPYKHLTTLEGGATMVRATPTPNSTMCLKCALCA